MTLLHSYYLSDSCRLFITTQLTTDITVYSSKANTIIITLQKMKYKAHTAKLPQIAIAYQIQIWYAIFAVCVNSQQFV